MKERPEKGRGGRGCGLRGKEVTKRGGGGPKDGRWKGGPFLGRSERKVSLPVWKTLVTTPFNIYARPLLFGPRNVNEDWAARRFVVWDFRSDGVVALSPSEDGRDSMGGWLYPADRGRGGHEKVLHGGLCGME